jgi:hypothetical protein
MTAITYLDNPADIKRYLIPSRENIVFVWQYFDGTSKTWCEIAEEVKRMRYNTEIIGVTSINLSEEDRKYMDHYINTSRKMNETDWAYKILSHIKNKLPKNDTKNI